MKNRLLFPEAGGQGRRGCDGLSVPPKPRRTSISANVNLGKMI